MSEDKRLFGSVYSGSDGVLHLRNVVVDSMKFGESTVHVTSGTGDPSGTDASSGDVYLNTGAGTYHVFAGSWKTVTVA